MSHGPAAEDARLIGDVLDPVLVPHGFSSAQVGTSGTRVESVHCAGPDDLLLAHPWLSGLVAVGAPKDALGTGRLCVDVTLDVETVPVPQPVRCVVEGTELPDLLQRVGRTDLLAGPAPAGLPVERALHRVAQMLRAVLEPDAAAAAGDGAC